MEKWGNKCVIILPEIRALKTVDCLSPCTTRFIIGQKDRQKDGHRKGTYGLKSNGQTELSGFSVSPFRRAVDFCFFASLTLSVLLLLSLAPCLESVYLNCEALFHFAFGRKNKIKKYN